MSLLRSEVFTPEITAAAASGVARLADPTDAIKSALLDTHASSLVQWQGRSIARALALLRPVLTVRPVSDELPSRASDPMTRALLELSNDVKRLGVPPGVQLGVVPGLLTAFTEKLRTLEWSSVGADAGDARKRAAGQAAFDLAFLLRLAGTPSAELAAHDLVAPLLQKVSWEYDVGLKLTRRPRASLRQTWSSSLTSTSAGRSSSSRPSLATCPSCPRRARGRGRGRGGTLRCCASARRHWAARAAPSSAARSPSRSRASASGCCPSWRRRVPRDAARG